MMFGSEREGRQQPAAGSSSSFLSLSLSHTHSHTHTHSLPPNSPHPPPPPRRLAHGRTQPQPVRRGALPLVPGLTGRLALRSSAGGSDRRRARCRTSGGRPGPGDLAHRPGRPGVRPGVSVRVRRDVPELAVPGAGPGRCGSGSDLDLGPSLPRRRLPAVEARSFGRGASGGRLRRHRRGDAGRAALRREQPRR